MPYMTDDEQACNTAENSSAKSISRHQGEPMKILCIIPSRIQSTRLPRKPLLPIQGKPMIQWVYENASRCPILDDVIVATDSLEISQLITQIGGKAILTDPQIPTGTDRVAHVAQTITDADIIINLQGDEPFVKPSMLETLVSPYLNGDNPDMTTLASHLDKEHYNNPGAVKVVTDLKGNALYFSRSPIPYHRNENQTASIYHHKGVYAFRRDSLMQYKNLPPTPLEQIESLEQLRALEHGHSIRVCISNEKTLEINTPEEYDNAQQFIYNLT
jgi:3-deoxy-manno-octulosonate cytidylyltransferase (CMP-KDO synthetase)